MDRDHGREIIDEIRRRASVCGPLLVLNDISALRNVPPDVRKLAAHAGVLEIIRAMAVFGGTFAQRIAVTLAVSAARLRIRGARAALRFFATEAEARAWLEEQRSSRAKH
jgi:hypothetical protein